MRTFSCRNASGRSCGRYWSSSSSWLTSTTVCFLVGSVVTVISPTGFAFSLSSSPSSVKPAGGSPRATDGVSARAAVAVAVAVAVTVAEDETDGVGSEGAPKKSAIASSCSSSLWPGWSRSSMPLSLTSRFIMCSMSSSVGWLLPKSAPLRGPAPGSSTKPISTKLWYSATCLSNCSHSWISESSKSKSISASSNSSNSSSEGP
mmetsp:Transcript_26194/g.61122  ORF Transcript_26194/g.61122 Transcript_26194/m.61122 type:complete len:204 (+) Transcript_26194:454-1065(+)